jgi:hypothetical protein
VAGANGHVRKHTGCGPVRESSRRACRLPVARVHWPRGPSSDPWGGCLHADRRNDFRPRKVFENVVGDGHSMERRHLGPWLVPGERRRLRRWRQRWMEQRMECCRRHLYRMPGHPLVSAPSAAADTARYPPLRADGQVRSNPDSR